MCGRENVLASREDLITLGYDATPMLAGQPMAGVIPRDVDNICQILTLANEEGISVVPRGSGTGLSGGSVPQNHSIVLLFPRWNKILEIDEANLTAWVQPGVITASLHQA
ncbi:MAG: FAD-binding protein, partial [Calditrichaeota bacterium]